MKKIVSDILKGKNIEDNLKAYYKGFMEINNKYAYISMSMNYFTYYGMVSEDGGILQSDNRENITVINNIISEFIDSYNEDYASSINKLEDLRERIIKKVQTLTCFVDRFNIYEHVLNRIEYRFKDKDFPANYSDENFTRELMQNILSDEDNVAINSKISQVIGELPIRLTKNKFYEIISDGLSIYNGGTKQSLNDFLYMLRTSSMLEKTGTMQIDYPELSEVFEQFENIDFRTISSEKYEELSYNISKASEYIQESMSSDMIIQEIINDLLVILYTNQVSKEDAIITNCKEIIKETNSLLTGDKGIKTEDEIEDMFVDLEGIPEQVYPKLTEFDVTDQIMGNYMDNVNQMGLEKEYSTVFKLTKLNSDSLFVELEQNEDNSEADEAYVEQQKQQLLNDYAFLFERNNKMINRAVMSAAISELPVFFNNISELQDFIYNNLSICTDKAEKLGCIEILNGIMQE